MFYAQMKRRSAIRAIGLSAVVIAVALASAADGAVMSESVWGASPSSDGTIDWSAGNAGFSHAISFEVGTLDNTTYDSADGYGLTGATTMTFYGASAGTYTGPGGSITLNTTNQLTGTAATIGHITQEFVYGGSDNKKCESFAQRSVAKHGLRVGLVPGKQLHRQADRFLIR